MGDPLAVVMRSSRQGCVKHKFRLRKAQDMVVESAILSYNKQEKRRRKSPVKVMQNGRQGCGKRKLRIYPRQETRVRQARVKVTRSGRRGCDQRQLKTRV